MQALSSFARWMLVLGIVGALAHWAFGAPEGREEVGQGAGDRAGALRLRAGADGSLHLLDVVRAYADLEGRPLFVTDEARERLESIACGQLAGVEVERESAASLVEGLLAWNRFLLSDVTGGRGAPGVLGVEPRETHGPPRWRYRPVSAADALALADHPALLVETTLVLRPFPASASNGAHGLAREPHERIRVLPIGNASPDGWIPGCAFELRGTGAAVARWIELLRRAAGAEAELDAAPGQRDERTAGRVSDSIAPLVEGIVGALAETLASDGVTIALDGVSVFASPRDPVVEARIDLVVRAGDFVRATEGLHALRERLEASGAGIAVDWERVALTTAEGGVRLRPHELRARAPLASVEAVAEGRPAVPFEPLLVRAQADTVGEEPITIQRHRFAVSAGIVEEEFEVRSASDSTADFADLWSLVDRIDGEDGYRLGRFHCRFAETPGAGGLPIVDSWKLSLERAAREG